MAHSLSDELRQPPSPARLADMVLRHSFDDRRYLGARRPANQPVYACARIHNSRNIQHPLSSHTAYGYKCLMMLQPRGHGPGTLGAALAAVVLAAAGQLSCGAAAAGKGGGGGKGGPGRWPLRRLRRGAGLPAPRVHHVRLLHRCASWPSRSPADDVRITTRILSLWLGTLASAQYCAIQCRRHAPGVSAAHTIRLEQRDAERLDHDYRLDHHILALAALQVTFT